MHDVVGIGSDDVLRNDATSIRVEEGPRSVGVAPCSLPRRSSFAKTPQHTAQRQHVVTARGRQRIAVIRDERDWLARTSGSRKSLAPDPKVVSDVGDIGDEVPGQLGRRLVAARLSQHFTVSG